MILGTRALCILPSRPALATDRAMEALPQSEHRPRVPPTLEPPRRRAEPHGGSAATKRPSGHYARGFGRCPFGGEPPLMEKAAARSDNPGEAGRPQGFQIDGRPVERWVIPTYGRARARCESRASGE